MSTVRYRDSQASKASHVRSALLLTVFAALSIGAAPAARATLSFTTLNDPADTGEYLVASGINDSGTIVGTYSNGSTYVGFYLAGGNYSPVAVPESGSTVVTSVTNAGVMTGYYVDTTDNQGTHGFTGPLNGPYTPYNNANALSTGATYALATNGSGTTVGYYYDNNYNQHAFVGSATVDFPTAFATQANDINSSGVAVGTYTIGSTQNAFVDNNGALTQFVNPLNASFSTVATGIDARGDIVGYYTDGSNVTHGFVYVVGSGTFLTIDDPNADTTTEVLGVNDNDMIVGMYMTSAGTFGFEGYNSALPEPGTLAMFALATFGAGLLRRRRVVKAFAI